MAFEEGVQFTLMDDDDKPYSKHQILLFLSSYLPSNIPIALYESFLIHIWKPNLIVGEYLTETLKSDILYEFDNILLKQDSSLTTDAYNENTNKGGVLLLKVKNNIILNEGSWIDLIGLRRSSFPHDGTRLGGSIRITCTKLIINISSHICCDGESIIENMDAATMVHGGSIHIMCNELINKGCISAVVRGKIRIDCNKVTRKGYIIPDINIKRKRENNDGIELPKKKRRKVSNDLFQ